MQARYTRMIRSLALPMAVVAMLFLGPALVRAAAPDGASQDGQKAWKLLEEVRGRLVAAGPTTADFVQTYVPQGFTSGDTEHGVLSIALPDCLRWDYRDPYPKSYLLCGTVAYSWNEGEKAGQRTILDPKKEPGLDLLLLGVHDLSRRYRAKVATLPSGEIEIKLENLAPEASIASAVLTLDHEHEHVIALEYKTREGDETDFTFSGFKALTDRAAFIPPRDIHWIE